MCVAFANYRRVYLRYHRRALYIDMFHAISLSIMCAYDTFTAASLNLLGHTLKWHRLVDGVMGGQSETLHASSTDTDELHFTGQINTQGGGFCR